MSPNDARQRMLIAEQAAAWLVVNRAGPSSREREEFTAWLVASPVHVEEYLGLAAIAADLRDACSESAPTIEALVERARAEEEPPVSRLWSRLLPEPGMRAPPRPRALAALAASAVVGALLVAVWGSRTSPRRPSADAVATLRFQTRHGEQQTHRLTDGTVVHLNTDSSLSVSFSDSERIVMLGAGEADFEVSHDPKRPFRVFAGAAETVDIGTQFDVRLEPGSTLVTVLEGRVAVGPSSMLRVGGGSGPGLASFVPVAADQQILVTDGPWLGEPVPVDAHRSASWLHRQIAFDHEPLGKVAAEFNRYSTRTIQIDTPALRTLEISGVFATDDIDAFVAFLRSLQGVRVEITADHIHVKRD